MADENGRNEHPGDPTYETMLTLEHLESLLEELEEEGFDGREGAALPHHLREQMDELGVANTEEIERRIAQLHAELDQVGDQR